MNWTRDKSIRLSKVCTLACAAALAGLCTAAAAGWPAESWRGIGFNWYAVTLFAFAVSAFTAMGALYRLLHAISRSEVFVPENVRRLRVISWCCFAAAAVFLASSLYRPMWGVLALAGAFGGMVLRVVKNVFAAAVALQNEHDLTI